MRFLRQFSQGRHFSPHKPENVKNKQKYSRFFFSRRKKSLPTLLFIDNFARTNNFHFIFLAILINFDKGLETQAAREKALIVFYALKEMLYSGEGGKIVYIGGFVA